MASLVLALVGCTEHGAPAPPDSALTNVSAAYAAHVTGAGTMSAFHPSMRLRSTFGPGQVSLVAASDERAPAAAVELAAVAWGCTNAMQSVTVALPKPSLTHVGGVEYQHAGFTEWYVPGPSGLEQGFTIEQLPACAQHGEPLRVRLAFRESDDRHGALSADGRQATLSAPGARAVHYGEAFAADAAGTAHAVRITLEEQLSLEIDAEGAVLPLVVDPVAWVQQQKLLSPDSLPMDWFGSAVAMSAQTAIVGAYESGNAAGVAYVFSRTGNTWTLQQTLVPSDAKAGAWFGYSVAISGDTLVVGQPQTNLTGAAYVFVRTGNTWLQTRRLAPSDPAVGDLFGTSVAISGSHIVVGSPHKAGSAAALVGAAYVFEGSGGAWTQQAKLIPTAGASDNNGAAVAIAGNLLVVGTDRPNGYVASYFALSGGIWTAAGAVSSTSATLPRLGSVLAMSNDYTVLGSLTLAGVTPGVVLVVNNGVHATQYTLLPSDGLASDQFGTSVAISDTNRVLVGSPRDDDKGMDSGSVYAFTLGASGFTQDQKLTASDGLAGDTFGSAVALSGTLSLIGAPTGKLGAAYVESFASTNGTACSQNSECGSGFCVERVCCNSACSGTCQSCLQSNKGGGAPTANGVCGNIKGGTDPYDSCTLDAADGCGQNGQCSGQGTCAKWPAGTSCTYAECAGPTTGTLSGACDPTGACKPTATVPCQLGYECVAGSCKSGCTTNGDCDGTRGFSCAESGQCKQPKGTACTSDVNCSTGSCQFGFCCFANADGACVKPLGTPCADALECASGSCSNGVCCAFGSVCNSPPEDGGVGGNAAGGASEQAGNAGFTLGGNAGFGQAGSGGSSGFAEGGLSSSAGAAQAGSNASAAGTNAAQAGSGGNANGGGSGRGGAASLAGNAGAAVGGRGMLTACETDADCSNGLGCDLTSHTCQDRLVTACGCRVPGTPGGATPERWLAGLALSCVLWRRRRRR